MAGARKITETQKRGVDERREQVKEPAKLLEATNGREGVREITREVENSEAERPLRRRDIYASRYCLSQLG